MKRTIPSIVITFLTVLYAANGYTEDRYVTDLLKLNLRTGASSQHKIINQLRSGDRVQVLATDGNGEFARVRTSKGQEGWALIGYLQKKPTAKVLLATASKKLQVAEKKLQTTSASNLQLASENKKLLTENKTLFSENEILTDEYTQLKSLSGNAVNISRKNRELLEQNNVQKNELEMQSAEVSRLQERISSDQFYMGAGAILLGLILGLVLPHMRPRQKSAEWA